uniref:Uncharacterized protein n=1 Tax=Chromera velia CCMP2878 TaxID=1169474 RepID=A0A0G4FY77_9ALVE|eukprot:Cvel_3906.t1-p1 / transcript=Cvel_3906.t1 / gene=Cvel_3906 / organism=Chromera_velia_CCMP2878 / gene_product=hypothetical protein / transcript_product=hypothetical protein / location=Cvel_scaffold165:78260-79138(-) / protein_length=293 / sequence_SO=supercontig / SO=protein_coding / is_pseudo=false
MRRDVFSLERAEQSTFLLHRLIQTASVGTAKSQKCLDWAARIPNGVSSFERGADDTQFFETSALELASRLRNIEAIGLLVAAGAHVNRVGDEVDAPVWLTLKLIERKTAVTWGPAPPTDAELKFEENHPILKEFDVPIKQEHARGLLGPPERRSRRKPFVDREADARTVALLEALGLHGGGAFRKLRADGHCPVSVACSLSYEKTVDLMLERGASPKGVPGRWVGNLKDRVPLLEALTHWSSSLVYLLLQSGADPNKKGLCDVGGYFSQKKNWNVDYPMMLAKNVHPLQVALL